MRQLYQTCNENDPILMPEGMATNTRWLLQEFLWGGIKASTFNHEFSWQNLMLSERVDILEKPDPVPFSRTLIEFHSNIFACLATGQDVGPDYYVLGMLCGLKLLSDTKLERANNRTRFISGKKALNRYGLRFDTLFKTSPAGRVTWIRTR